MLKLTHFVGALATSLEALREGSGGRQGEGGGKLVVSLEDLGDGGIRRVPLQAFCPPSLPGLPIQAPGAATQRVPLWPPACSCPPCAVPRLLRRSARRTTARAAAAAGAGPARACLLRPRRRRGRALAAARALR